MKWLAVLVVSFYVNFSFAQATDADATKAMTLGLDKLNSLNHDTAQSFEGAQYGLGADPNLTSIPRDAKSKSMQKPGMDNQGHSIDPNLAH